MPRTRRRTHSTLALLALFPLSIPALASIEAPGPAYVDWKRGIEKQTQAASAAKKEVEAGAPAAVRALELLADTSGYVRDAVFATLLEKWPEETLLALAPGLIAGEPLIAEAVGELFGRRKPAGGVVPLVRCSLTHPFEDVRAMAVWALGEYDEAAAKQSIRSTLSRDKHWLVRAEALVALARLEGVAAREAIDSALAEKKLLPLRIAALRALEQFDGAGAFSAALEQLAEPPKDRQQIWGPRVEIAALTTLARVDRAGVSVEIQKSAIDALLESLDDATGRARRARFEALGAITGEAMPFEALNWRAWWSAKRETWQPPSAGVPGKRPAQSGGGTSVVSFHGIPVDSERVTFLQDLSGGMSRTLSGEQGGSGPSRLDHAKGELARVLTALDDRTWVNVITFASTYFAAHPEPQRLERARRRIVEFCQTQEIPTQPGHARGNVYDALAFSARSPFVDTIYLVSEGAPTEGKYHDYDRFLWHFERLNRWTCARVHVLLVAETGGRNRAFVDRLAERSGGEVRAVTAGE